MAARHPEALFERRSRRRTSQLDRTLRVILWSLRGSCSASVDVTYWMLEAKANIAGDLTPELSIVMPCLNEAQTVGICIQKALAYLEMYDVHGEVIVADNGS